MKAALLPLAFALLSTAAPAIAQDLPNLPIQFNSGQTANRGRIGSASGECSESNGLVKAIAYTDPQTQAPISALTSQAQPTLWFYLPTPIADDSQITLVVKSSLGATLDESSISGQTDSAGIVGIPLTANLTTGDLYEWSLTLYCTTSESEHATLDGWTLSGWIERSTIDPALRQTFEAVSDRNRAALYANYGYLQDAAHELATLRQSNPTNEALTQDWSAFLRDLNLTELAAEPILNCCQIASAAPAEEIEKLEETEPTEQVEEPEAEPEAEPTEPPEQDTRTILQRARDRG